jgi:hypothetical protein
MPIAGSKIGFYRMWSFGIKQNPENTRQTHILSALVPSHLTTVAYTLDAFSLQKSTSYCPAAGRPTPISSM